MNKGKFAGVLAVLGAILCVGVAVHEWVYYAGHPYRTGVSGVLVILGFGAALGCIAVAVLASARREAREDAGRMRKDSDG